MKKLFLFLLSLYLCSVGVPILAQDAELVPAMVVQMADGSKQVVQLDYTSVTDFSVLVSKGIQKHIKWREKNQKDSRDQDIKSTFNT